MKFSPLSQVLRTERYRPKAVDVGHAYPVIVEVECAGVGELLATNMKSQFMRTRLSSQGMARYAFSECSLEKEDALAATLFEKLAKEFGPQPLGLAKAQMLHHSVGPVSVVGSGVQDKSLKVVEAGLPEGSALLFAAPGEAGIYTRVGDHVGVLLTHAGVTAMAVTL